MTFALRVRGQVGSECQIHFTSLNLMPQIFFAKGLDPCVSPSAPAFAHLQQKRPSTRPDVSPLSFPGINGAPQACISGSQQVCVPECDRGGGRPGSTHVCRRGDERSRYERRLLLIASLSETAIPARSLSLPRRINLRSTLNFRMVSHAPRGWRQQVVRAYSRHEPVHYGSSSVSQ